MAAYQQSTQLDQLSANDILILSYGTFEQLSWNVKFAGEERMIGYTPRSWKTYGEEILVEATDNKLTVNSTVADENAWNKTKKNQKNVEAFLASFEAVKSGITEEKKEAWKEALDRLRAETSEIVKKELAENEEVERVMNLSTGSRSVSYSIIGINLLVFAIMVISGVSFFEPSTQELFNWGANYSPYTLDGEAWRLFTSTFLHFGIVHLLFNMYALLVVGNYLEPMLGKIKFTAAYVATGILASVASIWWHGDKAVSAGASGAIFGMYGVFLALLTTRLIPASVRKALLQSIGIFILYNILYGMREGVDNAAHMGGLVSGFVIGYVYYAVLKQPAPARSKLVAALVLVISLGFTFFFVQANKSDTKIYEQQLSEFLQLQEGALKPFSNTVRYASDVDMLKAIETGSLSSWKKAKALLEATKSYHLNDFQTKQRDLYLTYAGLRIRETECIIEIRKGNPAFAAELEKVQAAIDKEVQKINALAK